MNVDEIASDGFAEEQALLEEPSFDEPAEDQAEPEPQPTVIEVEGQKLSVDDILKMRAESTQRFQEASNLKKEVEPMAQILGAWNHPDPSQRAQARRIILQTLSEDAGANFSAPAQTTPPDFSDWTEGEKQLHARNVALEQKIEQMGGMMQQLFQGFQQNAQQQQFDYATQIAVKSLAADGIQATPEQIVAAVKATGIQDPEAAFLKANKATLKNAVVTKEKPEGSSSAPRTFNADDPKYTADDIYRRLEAGWVDTSPTGHLLGKPEI